MRGGGVDALAAARIGGRARCRGRKRAGCHHASAGGCHRTGARSGTRGAAGRRRPLPPGKRGVRARSQSAGRPAGIRRDHPQLRKHQSAGSGEGHSRRPAQAQLRHRSGGAGRRYLADQRAASAGKSHSDPGNAFTHERRSAGRARRYVSRGAQGERHARPCLASARQHRGAPAERLQRSRGAAALRFRQRDAEDSRAVRYRRKHRSRRHAAESSDTRRHRAGAGNPSGDHLRFRRGLDRRNVGGVVHPRLR